MDFCGTVFFALWRVTVKRVLLSIKWLVWCLLNSFFEFWGIK